jgi:hypothetical protein
MDLNLTVVIYPQEMVSIRTKVSDVLDIQDNTYGGEGNTILADVLANDTRNGEDLDSEESEHIELAILEDPEHGTAELVDNKVQYTPDSGYSGTDELTYQVKSTLPPLD